MTSARTHDRQAAGAPQGARGDAIGAAGVVSGASLPDGPAAMSPLQRRVWTFLGAHARGRAAAMKSERLQRTLGVTKRALHEAMHDLAVDHAVPIASATTGARRGVYLAETLGELEDYRAQLVARLTGLRPRIDAVERMIEAKRRNGKPRQQRLF